MFEVGEWYWEHIICILDVLKNNFDGVDEEIFQSVERICLLIFFILVIEKSDLDEFLK
jgi:hypothetical protein